MGNFEKLGILVIIVLVVTILVLTFWGMNIPIADEPPLATELSGRLPGGDATPPVDPPKDDLREPKRWPDPPEKPIDGKPVDGKPVDLKTPVDQIPPIPPATDLRHTVKKGETLWGIAAQYYGHGKRSSEIRAANPGVTPENLRVGQVLTIPSPDQVLAGGPAPDRPVPDGVRTYQVKKGDSLSVIARRELGAENRWREIHQMNQDVIGPDASRVQPGMTLVLPQ